MRQVNVPWYDREVDPEFVAVPILADLLGLSVDGLVHRCRKRGVAVTRVRTPTFERPYFVSMIDGDTPVQVLLEKGCR